MDKKFPDEQNKLGLSGAIYESLIEEHVRVRIPLLLVIWQGRSGRFVPIVLLFYNNKTVYLSDIAFSEISGVLEASHPSFQATISKFIRTLTVPTIIPYPLKDRIESHHMSWSLRVIWFIMC